MTGWHGSASARRRGWSIVALAAAVIVAGCAAVVLRTDERPSPEANALVSPHPPGGDPVPLAPYPRGMAAVAAGQREALAEANATAVAWHRTAEAPFYPGLRARPDDDTWPRGLPRLCVALSSGGLRSSAISIGLLQGLAETGVLDRVDLVSGVSGGAFALAWLHGQALQRGATAAEILAEGGASIAQVERRPELTSRFRTVANILRHAAITPGRITSETLRALLGDSEPYESTLGDHYADALRRMFLSNGDAPEAIALESWREWLRTQRPGLPFPVVMASIGTYGNVGVCRTRPDGAPWLAAGVPAGTYVLPFEITPLRIGSDAIGHTDAYARPTRLLDRTDFDLARVLATSGAAIDIPARPDCALSDLVGGVGASFFDLVTERAPDRDGGSGLHRQTLHLTDGAYSDNLAVYSPIRRLCRRIVVVDSEFDPYLIFDGYRSLQDLLARTSGMQVALTVPGVDALMSETRIICDGAVECWKQALARCPDDPRCWTSDRLPRHVFSGAVGPFPFPGRPDGLTLDIIYLKLGIVPEDVARYPGSVRAILDREAMARGTPRLTCDGTTMLEVDCPFPQDSLLRLGYAPDRFRAYRELGRFLGAERLAPVLLAAPD